MKYGFDHSQQYLAKEVKGIRLAQCETTVLSLKFIGEDTTGCHSALSAEEKNMWYIIQKDKWMGEERVWYVKATESLCFWNKREELFSM